MKNIVLTYGTFDLFHIGHLSLLGRLRALGDRLIVGVSTDAFNQLKGKRTVVPFEDRAAIVRSLRCVDDVFPEDSWEQKATDIRRFNVSILGMGHDWTGKFDELSKLCRVVYLPRTPSVSSTEFKRLLRILDQSHVKELKEALDAISAVVKQFE